MALIPNSSLPYGDNATNGIVVGSDAWNQMVQVFQMAINANWNALLNTGTGTSASEFIGSAAIPGVANNVATNIYKQLYDLKQQLSATPQNIAPELTTIPPIALNPAYALQILSAQKAAPYNVLSITGRTLVNLLGRNGNCEDVSKFNTGGNGTAALDTANKVYGNNSLKLTLNSGTSVATSTAINFIANKYYVVLADIKNGNATNVNVAVQGVNSQIIADTTKFNMVYIKVNKIADILTNVDFFVTGSSTQYGFIDGIRVYEITQSDYNALGTTLIDLTAIAAKYPYVDDVKHVNAPYVIRYGENLLPTFNEWTLAPQATVLEPYKLQLVATALSQNSVVIIPVAPNQQYTISGTNGQTININVYSADEVTSANLVTNNTSNSFSFTTPSYAAKIYIYFSNGTIATGTFVFDKLRLNIGAVDKGFKLRNDDYVLFPNTAIASSVDGTIYDQIFRRDGKFFRENRFVRDMVVDGSLTYSYIDAVVAGRKRIQLTGTFGAVASAVKYDGKILTNGGDTSGIDGITYYNPNYAISVANADSGWADAYTPTAGEIQAYFYGYKMNNGTFGTAYNGTGTKTWTLWNATSNTGSVTVLPTTIASGFTPYKLTYQLATSILEEIPFEGSITTLEGSNQFEVGNGMIVREKANPSSAGTTPTTWVYINDNIIPASALKNRALKILNIYKNGRIDNTWGMDSSGQAPSLGQRAFKLYATFDPTATYEVTYLALDQFSLSTNVQTINGEYDTNLKMVVDRLSQNQADIDTRVSVMENNKARKVQGQWIIPTLLNAWVNYGGGYETVAYMKDDMGFVHLKGLIKLGTIGTVAFIMPVGYRPLLLKHFISLSNGAVGTTQVLIDGSINIATGSNVYVSLDGITFLAEQ